MSDEQLDQRIRDAVNVEPAQEQLARLEVFWRIHSRRERRWRTGRRVLALAASLLAVAAVAGWVARRDFREERIVQAPRHDTATTSQPIAPLPRPAQVVDVETSTPSAGRAPTALELLAYYSRTERPRCDANETLGVVVEDMIQQMIRGETDPQMVVESGGIAMVGVERELLRRLVRSTDDEKRALLRLLSACGSERSTTALLRLSRREAFREEALATIERIVGATSLADVVRASNDARTRRHFMQRMLTEESDQTVASYLSLVQEPAIRDEALAAAELMGPLPTESLLRSLQSDEKSKRLAAALVLGHVNGPEISRRLVDMVTGDQSAPTEAWMALLNCRGEIAREFLSYATRQPQLLGQVNHARVEWARMSL